MKKVSAILLAAGESRRTGRENKLLFPFKDKTLVRHVVEELLLSDIHECIVVVGCQAKLIIEQLKSLSVRFVENKGYSSGMTSSVHTGLNSVSPKADAIMICFSDMPLLKSAYYNALIRKYQAISEPRDSIILRPVQQEKKGHPILLSNAFIQDFQACKDPEDCSSVLQKNIDHVYEYPISSPAFYTDINTLKEYYRLRE